jgi:hypothetical protein
VDGFLIIVNIVVAVVLCFPHTHTHTHTQKPPKGKKESGDDSEDCAAITTTTIINTKRHHPTQSSSGMAKDKKGVARGRCKQSECDCDEYENPATAAATTDGSGSTSMNAGSHLCAYCGHFPVDHENLGSGGGGTATTTTTRSAMTQSSGSGSGDGGQLAQRLAAAAEAAAQAAAAAQQQAKKKKTEEGGEGGEPGGQQAGGESQCPKCGATIHREYLADHTAVCKGDAPPPASSTTTSTTSTTATTTSSSTAPPPPPPSSATTTTLIGWPKDVVESISALVPGFPQEKIEETLRTYPNKGDVDGVIALIIATADAAASGSGGGGGCAPQQSQQDQQQQQHKEWPADAVDTLAQSLPETFAREKIEEMLKAYPGKGDMDGLLALLFAAADADAAAAAKAKAATAEPDAETLKLIAEMSVAEKECILCLDTFPVTQMYTVNCPSAHRFCFDCIARYVEMCIKDNLPAVCPAPRNTCQHVLGEDELYQVAGAGSGGGGGATTTTTTITREKVAKYSEQMLLRCIKSIPGIIGCPTSGCGNWVIPADTRRKERCQCQACNATFCSLCKKTYHYHCGCEDIAGYMERWMEWSGSGRRRYNRDKAEAMAKIEAQRAELERRNAELRKRYSDTMADEQYKEANGRHCPKCNRIIIKDGGCDSMVCGRDYHGGNVQDGCGAAFSWSSARPYRSSAAAAAKPTDEPVKIDIPDIARELVHVGVACDRCKKEIKGLRFSCVHCPSVDLCERCEVDGTLNHPRDHVWRIISELSE